MSQRRIYTLEELVQNPDQIRLVQPEGSNIMSVDLLSYAGEPESKAAGVRMDFPQTQAQAGNGLNLYPGKAEAVGPSQLNNGAISIEISEKEYQHFKDLHAILADKLNQHFKK